MFLIYHLFKGFHHNFLSSVTSHTHTLLRNPLLEEQVLNLLVLSTYENAKQNVPLNLEGIRHHKY